MGVIIRRISRLSDESPILAKIIAVLTILLLVGISYFAWFRPYQLHWGATTEEISRPMPGDGLNPEPAFLATRAITIEASPEEVWPWLLQMGYGRAGFYGYDLLENLDSPEGLRSADEIMAKFQHFRVGDEVPISAVVSMKFHAIEPNRHLIWIGSDEPDPGAFTWALYPLESGRTRLVSRIRWSYDWTSISLLSLQIFTEFADHIAVRKVLQGVKDRVEGPVEPMWIQNVELFTFVATFFIFAAALLLMLRRRLTWHKWSAATFAGATWLVTWYAPLPRTLSIILALTAVAALYLTSRTHPKSL
ncbi:MAG: SRPBCC family protein [Acidobacteriota bacterium]|nr:MAG: SRPBCC family protein [Acidobacteriota bacterium]